MCVYGDSDTPRQQQMMEFADEEEELLRDHEQSLRQLEVRIATMAACSWLVLLSGSANEISSAFWSKKLGIIYSYRCKLGLYRIWQFQIHLEPDADLGRTCFGITEQYASTPDETLMVSAILSTAIKSQYSSVLHLLCHW